VGQAGATGPGSVKPIRLWLPSQNGLLSEDPHRHRAARSSELTSSPAPLRISIGPLTMYGPSAPTVIVTGGWTAPPSTGYSDDVMSAPYAAGAEPDDRPEPAQVPEYDEAPEYDKLPEYAAAVLDVVDLVPSGQVTTYGDVAAFLGRGGPRQVGHVMSHWGGAVAWWRVLRADGSPAPGLEREALAHYRRECTPLRPDGRRVDLRRARWAPDPLGLPTD